MGVTLSGVEGRAVSAVPITPTATHSTVRARILMSKAATERLAATLEHGVQDYVIMSVDGLLAVRGQLIIDSIRSDAGMTGGNVIIDWSGATISHNGNAVGLSRTELRLLAGLTEGNGNAVGRAALITRGWPRKIGKWSNMENALTVYICALRKRLAAIGLGGALETVRGCGYRLTL
jgi:DNA-binding response OmpR family regulator